MAGERERRRRWRFDGNKRLVASVIVFAGVVALLEPPRNRSSAQVSMAALVSASAADARTLEPRLSGGFAWAPFRPATRRAAAAVNPLRAAIETVLEKTGEATPPARHVTAVAELLAGDARGALEGLTAAAEHSNDPAVWNDLAAALHETARQTGAPELFADALAASDHALALSPDLPEALFNRAIVIERLGLREDARQAWTRYLASDSVSGWADEARQHVKALAPEPSALDRIGGDYGRIGNDPALALALARGDPFGTRAKGVTEVLGNWGRAVLAHDAPEAERNLKVARQLGSAVTLAEGDQMLERAVAVIDAADEATRLLLASAHAGYRDGFTTFQSGHPVDAEPMFQRAAAGFEKAQSPMALPARFFAANMRFEQGHHDAAEQEIEELVATLPAEFPGYRALLLRQLGACHAGRADWGAAITVFEQSTSLFEQLGESQNAAAMKRLLSFVYDRVGDPATAWKYRFAALHVLGGQTSVDLERLVSSIADAAILRRDWQTALSFLTLETEIAGRMHADMQLASALLIRAVVRDQMNDGRGASADIVEARAAEARVKDPSYRAYLRVAELRASAMLSGTPPAEAASLLTEAIEFQATQGDLLRLPGLFLQRARALRRLGNVTAAMADLRHGINELERHRQSLPEGEARWGAFHAAEELFDEGIDLAESTNDADAAFRFAERARGRALTESYRGSPILDYRSLPAGTVVVEYASLPSRLIIFTADASGVRSRALGVDRKTLAAEVDALSGMLQHEKRIAVNGATASVYRRLIEPIAPQLLGATTVVFVTDAVTSTVAFSALTDARGQYLIERFAIVMAPSAAAFVAARERRKGAVFPPSALVISTSKPGVSSNALVFTGIEAERVAKAYSTATSLKDDRAELDELIKRAPDADVIHFAGHAIGDDHNYEPASLVLRQNGRERRVGVTDLAKLRLRPTAVVVLAGCSTARGQRRASEGVISIAQGFLTAGAPSVIATLWQVSDEASSIFFPRLHERLAKGIPPAEALRDAQIDSIRRGDVPASLWAAVQDIGN